MFTWFAHSSLNTLNFQFNTLFGTTLLIIVNDTGSAVVLFLHSLVVGVAKAATHMLPSDCFTWSTLALAVRHCVHLVFSAGGGNDFPSFTQTCLLSSETLGQFLRLMRCNSCLNKLQGDISENKNDNWRLTTCVKRSFFTLALCKADCKKICFFVQINVHAPSGNAHICRRLSLRNRCMQVQYHNLVFKLFSPSLKKKNKKWNVLIKQVLNLVKTYLDFYMDSFRIRRCLKVTCS